MNTKKPSPTADFAAVMYSLSQIGILDSGEQRNTAMDHFLQELTIYTKADSCCIFEHINNDTYERTYKYMTDHSLYSQTDHSLYSQAGDSPLLFTSYDLPHWHNVFSKGDSIILHDIEEICDDYPVEYALLKKQNLQSVIIFPICFNKLVGFVKINNPKCQNLQALHASLPVIGNYLGSVRANYQKSDILEKHELLLSENKKVMAEHELLLYANRQALAENQQELAQNRQTLAENRQQLAENRLALNQERLFLNVLCRDYTAVLYVDLNTATVEILKMDQVANAARFISSRNRQKQSYTDIIERYCHSFIVEGQTEQFLHYMSIPYLMQQLQHRERIVFRYQSTPNLVGQQYFETQIVRLSDTEFDAQVLIGFRHIDDLIATEQKQQRDLKVALKSAQHSNEVLSALGKIYYSIFLIDLTTDHYEEISSDTKIHYLTGKRGQASTEMIELCNTLVVDEYREGISRFFDLSTLAKRLQKEDTIATEYLAVDGNWHTARFIVKNRNKSGQTTHVLYVTRLISDAKRREQNWIAIVEEANRANIAKTEFISQIAHDIRTPMNAIMGFTEITEAHINDPEQVRYGLDKIKVSGGFLLELVDDVLDISRIENGQMTLNPQKISIRHLYEDMISAFSQADRNKQLKYIYDIHDIACDGLLADPLRLKQIFTNILSNAVKYTPDGGQVAFELYEEASETEGKIRLIADISDTGIGMSEEYMKKMFTKFSRETDTRINKVNGHGLGLSIVKMLCDLMNGTIEVQSTPGKGTAFHLTFEFNCTSLDDVKDNANIPDYASICQGMHLLVAEDNSLNFEVIYELLRMNNITCDWANNGAVCVQTFQAAPQNYDAILMDLQMPVMDGIHATTVIRGMNLPEAHTIPIIAMTANAFQEDIQKCINAGMNLHLSKPVHIKKLLEALASVKR